MDKQEQKRLGEIVRKLDGLNSTNELSAQEQRDYKRLGAQWERGWDRENYGFYR